MTPPNIPLFYRIWHLYAEPLLALCGAYHLHLDPMRYHTYMPTTSSYNPSSQIVYDQLASSYLLFAFIEGVLLRVVHDVRIWWWIVLGLALCDAGHCYAACCEMGTAGLVDFGAWRRDECIANFLNVAPLVTRAAFLMGVGMGKGE
ncbi:hypothetical protein T440DRAFT_416439, partial [Plenodomus tracheiphilus IPT5]